MWHLTCCWINWISSTLYLLFCTFSAFKQGSLLLPAYSEKEHDSHETLAECSLLVHDWSLHSALFTPTPSVSGGQEHTKIHAHTFTRSLKELLLSAYHIAIVHYVTRWWPGYFNSLHTCIIKMILTAFMCPNQPEHKLESFLSNFYLVWPGLIDVPRVAPWSISIKHDDTGLIFVF